MKPTMDWARRRFLQTMSAGVPAAILGLERTGFRDTKGAEYRFVRKVELKRHNVLTLGLLQPVTKPFLSEAHT